MLALTLAACGSLLSPGERKLLSRAESRWNARGFGDYSIEMQRLCFCDPETLQWTRIDVVDGRVVRATIIATGEPVQNQYQTWETVEEIFDLIREAGRFDWVRDVEAEYDPALGFPSSVTFHSTPDVLDAGLVLHLRNARPYSP